MSSASRKLDLTPSRREGGNVVFAAMARAPVDEPLDPELEMEYARRAEDLRSGRVVGVWHDAVQEKIAQMGREPGE